MSYVKANNLGVKIIFTLLFILSLVTSALSGVGIETHDDHSHEQISVPGHNHHNHDHKKESKKRDSEKSEDCPHFHIHCSSLCLGVLLNSNLSLIPLCYVSYESTFSLLELSPQDFANSLYRPPIA
jgi:hypothetical protein